MRKLFYMKNIYLHNKIKLCNIAFLTIKKANMQENTIPTDPQEEEALHHPGDKGFKAAMKVKETALEYVQKFYPKLYAHLDISRFEMDNTNYVSKEDYLSADEIAELFGHYLSPKQKNNMETTYQVWKREGRQEGLQEGMSKGEIKKARSMVLRGIWKGLSADLLADQSELPYAEVVNLFKGYDKVYQFWLTNKNSRDKLPVVAHLSKEEVIYLLNLFDKEQ